MLFLPRNSDTSISIDVCGGTVFSEVLIFLDPRFPGGTTSAVLSEISALNNLGIVPGLCFVRSPVLSGWRDYHPGIAKALAAGKARVMDVQAPLRCNIALIHHPMVFEQLPAYPVSLQAEHMLLVLQHPPLGGSGDPEYDLVAIIQNIEACLGRAPLLAPVGPAVRSQLDDLGYKDGVLGFDWYNLVDDELWRCRQARPENSKIVIGRHSRPEGRKYPLELETALQAYPDDPRFEIRMLGADPNTLEKRYGTLPSGWKLEAFRTGGVQPFLEEIDYWVFHHGPEWIEAFGIAIVEAILLGVPAILAPHFEPLFGEAAIYGEPYQTIDIINRIEADPDAYGAHVVKARTLAKERFGLEAQQLRFDRLYPLWQKRPKDIERKAPAVPKPKRRVLMMTSNGVGLGHVTRLLAIADRFDQHIETAFLTMSQAFNVIEERGYITQFIPFHRLTQADNKQWNRALAEEISDMIQFFRPDLLVFDGNTPYAGLISALERHPRVSSIWVRRAMWPSDKSELLKRSASFDTVIEPGELAARFDDGPTVRRRSDAFGVAPILLCNPEDRMHREEAREHLSIRHDQTAVGFMIGAGTNFSFREIREQLLSTFQEHDDVQIVEIVSPVRALGDNQHEHQFEAYPAFRFTRAFDFMVTSAGYNSFHEAILGAIPTIFIPNQAWEMDRQDTRARMAKASGWSEVLTQGDLIGAKAAVEKMLDINARAEMERRMRRVRAFDGAKQAARFIERQLAYLPAHRRMI